MSFSEGQESSRCPARAFSGEPSRQGQGFGNDSPGWTPQACGESPQILQPLRYLQRHSRSIEAYEWLAKPLACCGDHGAVVQVSPAMAGYSHDVGNPACKVGCGLSLAGLQGGAEYMGRLL